MKKNILVSMLCLMAIIYSACSGIQTPDLDTYRVSYDNNEGSGVVDGISEVEGFTVTAASGASLVKTGFTFICWNTSIDGSGEGYGAGLDFLMPSEDTILYAQWIADPYIRMDTISGPPNFNMKDAVNSVKYDNTIPDFELGRYEVTYELWYTITKFAEANGYIIGNKGTEGTSGSTVAGEPPVLFSAPVTSITWRDAIIWCNALSEVMALTPVYENSITGQILRDSTNEEECDYLFYNTTNNGFSLPTEAEWQFAASNVDDSQNSMNEAFDPNSFGTLNLSGYPKELCFDWHGEYPLLTSETDYYIQNSNRRHIFRDGTIGARDWQDLSSELSYLIGFRIKRR